MPEALPLRDYQVDALEKLAGDWHAGIQRPAVVLPTGAGKTVVFSHAALEFCERERIRGARRKVLVLAHRDELVNQAARKVKQVAPHLPVGIVKAERNDVWAQVIVASVQTLRNPRRLAQLTNVGLVIVDECHHAAAQTYLDILTALDCFSNKVRPFDVDADVRCFGVTATLARTDGKPLGEVWESAITPIDILGLVRRGFLLDPKGKRVLVPDLNLRDVKRSRGDYQDGDLGRAMIGSLAPETVAAAYLEHAPNDHGVMFWPTVEAAQVGAEAMNAVGIPTQAIWGTMPRDYRRDILRRADAGHVQVLSNCMVLTEGFDWPRARVGVIARPTQSAPLYQQMVGRVLRPFPGQTDALLLDVVGASVNLNLASLVDLTEGKIKPDEGETLTEAAERTASTVEEEVEAILYRGQTVAAEFDPLGRSAKRVWSTTRGGTKFLALTDRYVFLVPSTAPDAEPGTWDVAWAAAERPINGANGGFYERGMELGYAASWAESEVDRLDAQGARSYTSKKSGWRKQVPTAKQVGLARRFGVQVTDGMKAGELSELIDAAKASPIVDFYVKSIVGE